MKFKLYYFYIAYEVGTFIWEMKKRNASSIKFEFQESVGKFNIYIDDSAFKTIDGKIGWQIIRGLYSTATKKAKDTFDKDKSFTDEDLELKTDDLNKAFDLKLLPLTKGRCLSYSYKKKKGGVYEACIKVKSDNLNDLINERIADVNEKVTNDIPLVYEFSNDESGVRLLEVENVFSKADKIKLYLIDEKGDDIAVTQNISDFSTKNEVKKFFNKIQDKPDITETNKEAPKDLSWGDEKDVSWD